MKTQCKKSNTYTQSGMGESRAISLRFRANFSKFQKQSQGERKMKRIFKSLLNAFKRCFKKDNAKEIERLEKLSFAYYMIGLREESVKAFNKARELRKAHKKPKRSDNERRS